MKAILSRLFNHEELTRKEAKNLLLNITRGMYNDAQIAALLTVFQMRGIKVEELIGFREALLTTRIPIDFSAYTPIDIVGTGGDGKNTFNISTCACFIVAGAGYHVAKHGNYGATSVSGASNVISTLLYWALASLSHVIFGWLPGFLSQIQLFQIGIPAFTGLYFDWFGGCIQAFIFCTLTAIFIKRAAGED